MNTRIGILLIGDELLNGDTKDTNAHYATTQLGSIGLQVSHILTSGDSADSIRRSMAFLLENCELVISTGGLGPTRDDVTKNTIAEYFGLPLVMDEDVLTHLHARYGDKDGKLDKLNTSQAMVPQGAEAIPSKVGTAPVIWLRREGKHFIALPGVPGEMQYLLKHELLPRLQKEFKLQPVYSFAIQTIGIPEATLAPMLEKIERRMEAAQTDDMRLKLAYLPTLGMVRLVVSAMGPDLEKLKEAVFKYAAEIKLAASEYIIGERDVDLPMAIGLLLLSRKATLATAESCTAGYVAHLITQGVGSSNYFPGGVVAYSNEIKQQELNVDPAVLEKHGAVSCETATAMAEGVKEKFNSTYAVSTTGLAGPGGDEDNPEGTIWIAISGPEGTEARKFQFEYSRTGNIQMFGITALDMLRRYILELPLPGSEQ